MRQTIIHTRTRRAAPRTHAPTHRFEEREGEGEGGERAYMIVSQCTENSVLTVFVSIYKILM